MQPKQGVRSRHTSHQEVSTTLERLVTSEAQEGTRQSIACLVRLIRYVSLHFILGTGSAHVHSGLLFTCRALENMQADRSSELQTCFRRSYDVVLKHHHGWFVQSAVTVGVHWVERTIGLFCFPAALSAGHQSSAVPIRVLQADIAGGIGGEAGRGAGQMARRAERDRRAHAALPGRGGARHGIESGGARRLSSSCTLWITDARSGPKEKR